MKKPLLGLISLFLVSFLYLHQKVHLHIEAYRLADNYRVYNELIDRRDGLVYNFSRQVSLKRLNAWARQNSFSVGQGEIIYAFDAQADDTGETKKASGRNLLARLNGRLFHLPGESEALAEENE